MPERELTGHDASLAALRRANMITCALYLRDHGSATVTQLAEACALSRPTVRAVLEDLGDIGLVEPESMTVPLGRGGGRPAQIFRLRSEAHLVAGVEIRERRCRVVVADLAGGVAAYADEPAGSGDRLEEAVTLAQSLSAGVGVGRLLALGIGVPGVVDAETGRRDASTVIPEWNGVDLREAVGRLTDLPVAVDNDINLAAVAESRWGAGAQVQDLIYALVWHQVSAGVIIGRRLHRGRHNSAGEISYLHASVGAPDPEWETEASVRSLVGRAAAGDQAALASVGDFATRAGAQVAALTMAIDPDVVVLGGELADADPLLTDLIDAAVRNEVGPNPLAPIQRSRLGTMSAALGAALLAYELSGKALFGPEGLPAPDIDLDALPSRDRESGARGCQVNHY